MSYLWHWAPRTFPVEDLFNHLLYNIYIGHHAVSGSSVFLFADFRRRGSFSTTLWAVAQSGRFWKEEISASDSTCERSRRVEGFGRSRYPPAIRRRRATKGLHALRTEVKLVNSRGLSQKFLAGMDRFGNYKNYQTRRYEDGDDDAKQMLRPWEVPKGDWFPSDFIVGAATSAYQVLFSRTNVYVFVFISKGNKVGLMTDRLTANIYNVSV